MLGGSTMFKDFDNMNQWKKHLQQFMNNENFYMEFNDMFGHFPQANVYKTENECILVANLPGVKNVSDINIHANYRTIEISGKIDLGYEGFQLLQSELHTGHFNRAFELPYPIREDKVEANYHRGLLIIQLYRSFPKDKSSHVSVNEIED
jgi:HSP20 family protein